MYPILMPPLVSCMWASCCNTSNLPQQQLGCSTKRHSWSWKSLYFSLSWLWSHHIWKATSSTEWQLCTELGGTSALGTCMVQIQEVRLWTKAVKEFPSWANTWLLRKAGLTYYCYYRRLRLWMENRWKTQGPSCTWLSKEQVIRKFGECTHPYRETLHTSTCSHSPINPSRVNSNWRCTLLSEDVKAASRGAVMDKHSKMCKAEVGVAF